MNTARLLAAGVLLLAAAAVLAPEPDPSPSGPIGAFGRSMGGARVMVIDALFFRAEAQRRQGRIEDAAALYRLALDLDPRNETAAIFLANLYADALMPQVVEARDRFDWWREARALLADALERRPDSPSLHARMATLIHDAPLLDPTLEPFFDEFLPGSRRVALRHLRHAVGGAETLPRLGRDHLVRISILAPHVAAEALQSGDESAYDEALAAADEALELRGALMAEITLDDEHEADLAQILRAGRAAVAATKAAEDGTGTQAEAERLIAAYESTLPDRRLAQILRRVLVR